MRGAIGKSAAPTQILHGPLSVFDDAQGIGYSYVAPDMLHEQDVGFSVFNEKYWLHISLLRPAVGSKKCSLCPVRIRPQAFPPCVPRPFSRCSNQCRSPRIYPADAL